MNTVPTDLEHYLISADASVQDALRLLESNDGKIVLVVDAQRILQGAITDGDVRRGFLNGHTAQSSVSDIMAHDPFCVFEDEKPAQMFSMMQSRHIRNIPIIDRARRVVDLVNMTDMIIPEDKDNWVVIMAGGFGSRLKSLTKTVPKPMLEVAGTPVLEHLISAFVSQGFRRFYVSVHYLSDQIKDYFGDGSSRNIEIRYIEEDTPLDTAGALSLLPHTPKDPFFVVNGDIITNVNFSDMLDFHTKAQSGATMGVREHHVQIPYGVVKLDDCNIMEFHEKPEEVYFVNTGIYVLDPSVLSHIGEAERLTMPALLERAKKDDKNVQAFPITEYWLDIGRMEDFAKAEDVVQKIVSDIV